MEADKIKWNTRFASQPSYLGERPSPFLLQEIERIQRLAPGRTALDIACGEGRNSIFLAQHGFDVSGYDISDVGLSKGRQRAEHLQLSINFQQTDLENTAISARYAVIINFNFLLRELIPQEIAALVPGGLLLFDTIMASEHLLQSRTAAYLLLPGELEQLFSGYNGTLLFSEESYSGEMPTARLLFQKAP